MTATEHRVEPPALDLDAIRERTARRLRSAEDPRWALGPAEADRVALLAEVDRLRAQVADLEGERALTEQHFSNYVADAIVREHAITKRLEVAEAERDRLRAQRDALIKLHEYDELIFGGFICTHCTPDDCDDPDDNVYWPCPSLRAVDVTDEEAAALITARRAEIERKAAEQAEGSEPR